MQKKFFAVAAFAFAFAFAFTASAVGATEIYTPATGFLKTGSGMGAKAYQASNVMAAQTALNACVPGTALNLDGKMGPLTTAKFKSFQASQGLAQDGIIGPLTAAKLAACSGSTTTGSTTTPTTPETSTTLNGTDGDLSFDTTADSDVTIDLGDSETVIAFEAEAQDGDVSVDRIDFTFDARPWLYFDEVNLLANGKEIASFSKESDFSEVSGDYRARFSGLKYVITEDKTVEFALELKTLSSMAGDRSTHIVTVSSDKDSVRFMDGSGAIMTSSDPEIGIGVNVDFDDTFGDGDIDVTIGDNSPEAATIVLKEDAKVTGVNVLEFAVEANDSDVEIKDIDVEFATTGSSVANTVDKAYLYKGSTLLKQKSVTGNIVSFDDLDYGIDKDDEEEFTVKLDFNKSDTLTLGDFTVVNAVVNAENSDYKPIPKTLTVGETHKLVETGLVDTFVSKSASTSPLGNNTNTATFTFKFDLTAYESDYFINENGSDFTVSLSNGDTGVISTTIASTNATLVASGTAYRINKGQTRSFTVDIEVAATSTGTPESVMATIDTLDYWTNAGLSTGNDEVELGAPEYKSTSKTVIKN